MNAPVLTARLDALLERREKLNAEIRELRHILGGGTEPGKRRSPNVEPACGTESAYQRHRYRGEPADDACRLAHNEHNRERSTT